MCAFAIIWFVIASILGLILLSIKWIVIIIAVLAVIALICHLAANIFTVLWLFVGICG